MQTISWFGFVKPQYVLRFIHLVFNVIEAHLAAAHTSNKDRALKTLNYRAQLILIENIFKSVNTIYSALYYVL